VSAQIAEQEGKRLELLKGLLPSFSRGRVQSEQACTSAMSRVGRAPPKARITSGGSAATSLRVAVVYWGKTNDRLLIVILSDHEIRTVVAARRAGHGLPQQRMDEGNFG